MVQKSDDVLLEKSLGQTGIVNWKVVLLKNPVVTTQTRALSHEGCPLQHLQLASCCLTPLHNLELHCSIEGKSTQIMMAPPPLCRVERCRLMVTGLQSEPVMALTWDEDRPVS
ncbi:unnamed protein product [Pleuronectes platessa]|uniref:Uncharacterized protein n=1 Tax=Pleuronectes platessa TaxID=8262 RepID=A0A9N7Y760_PLEPL|nr:unnamed protein product [Pleuronectes platessa]